MMCFGNSLSDRGSLYNVVDIVPFGLYSPPENVVPLQAKSSRLLESTIYIREK